RAGPDRTVAGAAGGQRCRPAAAECGAAAHHRLNRRISPQPRVIAPARACETAPDGPARADRQDGTRHARDRKTGLSGDRLGVAGPGGHRRAAADHADGAIPDRGFLGVLAILAAAVTAHPRQSLCGPALARLAAL